MPAEHGLAPQGAGSEADRRWRYASLPALVAELRRHSGGYVLTSVAHGARSERGRRTLDRLRLLGVHEHPAPCHADPVAAGSGFIVVRAHRTTAGNARPMPVLLVMADRHDRSPLSMPEKQQLRDAQRHFDLPPSCRIVMAAGGPAAGQEQDVWTELDRLGP